MPFTPGSDTPSCCMHCRPVTSSPAPAHYPLVLISDSVNTVSSSEEWILIVNTYILVLQLNPKVSVLLLASPSKECYCNHPSLCCFITFLSVYLHCSVVTSFQWMWCNLANWVLRRINEENIFSESRSVTISMREIEFFIVCSFSDYVSRNWSSHRQARWTHTSFLQNHEWSP